MNMIQFSNFVMFLPIKIEYDGRIHLHHHHLPQLELFLIMNSLEHAQILHEIFINFRIKAYYSLLLSVALFSDSQII